MYEGAIQRGDGGNEESLRASRRSERVAARAKFEPEQKGTREEKKSGEDERI